MPIGIIGPSKLSEKKSIRNKIKKISKIIAKSSNEIIISPDKKSTAEFFGKHYKDFGEKKIIGLDYKDDLEHEYFGLNRKICDKLIPIKSWENQPKELIKRSKHIIVLGLSVGVFWEICITKFYKPSKKSKIFVIKGFGGKLPKILNNNLSVKYLSIEELKKIKL